MSCDKCQDTGYVVKTETVNGHPYDYVYHCDCWTGINRNKVYPSIRPLDVEEVKLFE